VTVKKRASELVKLILKRRGVSKVHLVWYADDFVVVGPSKNMLLALMPVIDEFLSERGLEISKEKSSIMNIWESECDFWDFSLNKISFNYRTRSEAVWKKRKTKSLARIDILLTKQKLFKSRVKEIVCVHQDIPTLIITFNQYLRGWANYFNATSTSAEHVRKCYQFVFWLCWNKVKRLYPKLTKKELKRRFFPKHKFYQNGRYVNRV